MTKSIEVKSRLFFLPHVTQNLSHKGLGFSVYSDRKENTQTEGQEVVKYKAGEVYLVWHLLPHIPHPMVSSKSVSSIQCLKSLNPCITHLTSVLQRKEAERKSPFCLWLKAAYGLSTLTLSQQLHALVFW
jgi:hypothetical protein